MMTDGYIRVGAATPAIKVAECAWNQEQIEALMREADEKQLNMLVLPELCLTGYTCGDLFLSQVLLRAAKKSLMQLVTASQHLQPVFAVGLPLASGASLFNVAAIFQQGQLLAFIPKQHIPNYAEFYEQRHFTTGPLSASILFDGQKIPFGSRILFQCSEMEDLVIGFEICEDLWVAKPASTALADAGAVLIGNLSASDEIVSKAAYRRLLVQSQSARLLCGYVYADAGEGESTTDLVFSGHNLIYENGRKLAESELFSTGLICADLDIELLMQDRRRQNTCYAPDEDVLATYQTVPFSLVSLRRSKADNASKQAESISCLSDSRQTGTDKPAAQDSTIASLIRPLSATPFVPDRTEERDERCEEILMLQAQGLKKRLAHIGCRHAIIGLSGGLDSTLALWVTTKAFDLLGLDRKGVIGVTMPGFGTTDRTFNNTLQLSKELGITLREIEITDAVKVHFHDIGHDIDNHDVTFENAQARERTQILMDLANQYGGLVIGTGDLSELALGWATYNGDHMSMYAVNSSVPKTLIRYLVAYAAAISDETLRLVLTDILETPVSPELLPPGNGEIAQKTEHIVGPYLLHDFFLYYMVRYGFRPGKIKRLARQAFAGTFSEEEIHRWLTVFLKRFFAQQFKRSCMPDGPKVGSVTLSPRGDWRMPSDAEVRAWLEDLANDA